MALMDHSLEAGNKSSFKITPEIEFWGHASNIQVWIESGYDTRLLHANLAFPLLKRLAEEGEPEAQRKFKDEIAERLSSASPSVAKYLIKQGYLNHFYQEELDTLLESTTNIYLLKHFINVYKNEKNYDKLLELNAKIYELDANYELKDLGYMGNLEQEDLKIISEFNKRTMHFEEICQKIENCTNPYVLNYFINIFGEQGEYSKAEQLSRKILLLDPNFDGALEYVGDLTMEELNRITNSSINPRVLITVAEFLKNEKKYDEAKRVYLKILRIGNFENALEDLGEVLIEQKRPIIETLKSKKFRKIRRFIEKVVFK